jgi:hypothetical protein
MLISIKLVFSYWTYIAIAGTTATIFWIVFSIFEQLLFFSPIVVFCLPEGAIMGFIFSTITAILLGIVVSMNVYVFEHSRGRLQSVFFPAYVQVVPPLAFYLYLYYVVQE